MYHSLLYHKYCYYENEDNSESNDDVIWNIRFVDASSDDINKFDIRWVKVCCDKYQFHSIDSLNINNCV